VLLTSRIHHKVASASQAKENEGLRFLTSKAGVIDELEYTMPRWLKRRNPGWYPPYMHILRVSFLGVRLPGDQTFWWSDCS